MKSAFVIFLANAIVSVLSEKNPLVVVEVKVHDIRDYDYKDNNETIIHEDDEAKTHSLSSLLHHSNSGHSKPSYSGYKCPECICKCPSVNNNCPANEIWSTCKNTCSERCPYDATLCSHTCIHGCTCISGYRRSNYGVCIPQNSCPSQTCPQYEVWSTCKNACGERCPNDLSACPQTLACTHGCTCISGYRRSNGVCIPQNSCPSQTCPLNEYWNYCKSNCNERCPNDPTVCTEVAGLPGSSCFPGCNCVSGYYRYNGVCIPQNQCPTQTCSANEIYSQCAGTCSEQCPSYRASCIEPTVCTPKCVCKPGYVRIGTGCVPESQCNPQGNCPANQVYIACKQGGLCGEYCNGVTPPTNCNAGAGTCKSGCFCSPGYKYSDNTGNTCVHANQCPGGPIG